MMVNNSPGPVGGPVAPYMTGFREVLDAHGYAKRTSQQLVSLTKRLDRWLQRKELGIDSLGEPELQMFLDELRTETPWLHPTPASFTLLLEHLRGAGAVPMPALFTEPDSTETHLLDGFRRYLLDERALVARSVKN